MEPYYLCAKIETMGILKTALTTYFQEHLAMHCILISMCMVGMVLAMIIDYIYGIKKAKQRGEVTTSQKMKRTADKAQKYFVPYLCLILIDFICSYYIPVPAFSGIFSIYCIFCEFTSIREKTWKKAEIRKAENTISAIIENKDDIAKMVTQAVFAALDQKEKVKSEK